MWYNGTLLAVEKRMRKYEWLCAITMKTIHIDMKKKQTNPLTHTPVGVNVSLQNRNAKKGTSHTYDCNDKQSV